MSGRNPRQLNGLVTDPASSDVMVLDDEGLTWLSRGASPRYVSYRTGIALGSSGPERIAFDSARGRLFVTDRDGQAILVIETSTRAILHRIALGFAPSHIALDGTRNRLYVTGSELVAIDLTAMAIDSRANIGGSSLAVNPVNGKVYLPWSPLSVYSPRLELLATGPTLSGTLLEVAINPAVGPEGTVYIAGSRLYIVDSATDLAHAASLPVEARHLRPDPLSGRTYAAENDTLLMVDPFDNLQKTTIPGIPASLWSVTSLAVDSAGGRVFVAGNQDVLGGTLVAFDVSVATPTVLVARADGLDPDIEVAWSPSFGKLFARDGSGVDELDPTILDGPRARVATRLSAAATNDAGVSFLLDRGAPLVHTVRWLGAPSLVSATPVSRFPTAAAIDTSTNELYVTSPLVGDLSVLDATTGASLRRRPIPRRASGVASSSIAAPRQVPRHTSEASSLLPRPIRLRPICLRAAMRSTT